MQIPRGLLAWPGAAPGRRWGRARGAISWWVIGNSGQGVHSCKANRSVLVA